MSTSNIEWTQSDDGTPGRTWNPIVGCSMVSPGCANCYAETMSKRLAAMAKADNDAGKNPGRKAHYLNVMSAKGRWNGHVDLVPEALKDPFKWRKPCRVFVNSMSDLFHPDVPFEYVDRVWAVMAICPQHTFQILTKRPERMSEYLARTGKSIDFLERPAREIGRTLKYEYDGKVIRLTWPLPSVWLGTSTENQQTAEERIPHLLKCPADVRFISVEPMLGEIDLTDIALLDWVIVGGESGPGARAFDVGWARGIVNQCRNSEVPCFVKQLGSNPMIGDASDPNGWPTSDGPVNWETGAIRLKDKKGGEMVEWPVDLRVRQWPTAAVPV